MGSCLEIIYFISHLRDGEGCCLLMGREVLRCLLMVSTEKQRNENADISKKCHNQRVLWLCLLFFHPYRSQRILVCTDLDSRHKARMPAGLGASQKKEAGSWGILGWFLQKGMSYRNVFLFPVMEPVKYNWKKGIPALTFPFLRWP